jgi:hypothetical protein
MSKWGHLGIVMCLLLSTQVWASIGKVSLLKGEATANRNNQSIVLMNGTDIEKNDFIKTHVNSQIQLTFEDKTVITLGSESTLDIQDYLNDANNPKAKFKFNQGTFKTITGQIGKKAPENFNLETKTATIGIRGTTVVGSIGEGDSPDIIGCSSGRIAVSNENGSVIINAGFQTTVSKTQSPTPPATLSPTLLISNKLTPSVPLAKTSHEGEPVSQSVQTMNVAQESKIATQAITTNSAKEQQDKLDKADTIDAYISQPTTTSYTYNGSVTGSVSNGESQHQIDKHKGNDVKLDFDFGGGSGALKNTSYIKFQTNETNPQAWQISPSGTFDGTRFMLNNNNNVAINGITNTTSTSTIDGTFQNDHAKKVNGTFSATSGSNTATGVFKAVR